MKTSDFLKTLTVSLSLCLWIAAGAASAAESGWISDRLTVPVRSGPSNSHRILHRGLPSGTELTVLDRDADSGFVQIRTGGGTEGWIPEQYLVAQPIARDRLVAANRRIASLESTLAEQRSRVDDLSAGKSEADSSNTSLRRQVAALEQELAEIKRVSASALALNETNMELNELNGRLRAEVDDLVASVAALEDNVQERWLLIGGGLVLVGLICGVAIKARPRRSAWS